MEDISTRASPPVKDQFIHEDLFQSRVQCANKTCYNPDFGVYVRVCEDWNLLTVPVTRTADKELITED